MSSSKFPSNRPGKDGVVSGRIDRPSASRFGARNSARGGILGSLGRAGTALSNTVNNNNNNDGNKNPTAGPPVVPGRLKRSPKAWFITMQGDSVDRMLSNARSTASMGPSHPKISRFRVPLWELLEYANRCRLYYGESMAVSIDLWNGLPKLMEILESMYVVHNDEDTNGQRFFTDEEQNTARIIVSWISKAKAPEVASLDLDGVEDVPAAAKKYPIRKPDPNHPIWGRNGIMHGIALTGQNGKVMCYDPEFIRFKAISQIEGHNGQNPGEWHPAQIKAAYEGAHGAGIAGIAGIRGIGAFSVVVSGFYGSLDEDHGDRVWYSASNSLQNKDPDNCAKRSNSSQSLYDSFAMNKVLRLFRKASDVAKHNSRYAPSCGIRYDGLYGIEEVDYAYNKHGGKVERFLLVRLEKDENGPQRPLASILHIPTPQQQQLYREMKKYY